MNKPSLVKCLLGLIFFADLLYLPVEAQKTKTKDAALINRMIVLKILTGEKGDTCVGVIFQTSQRIYKLPLKAKAIYLRVLKESLDKHIPVLVKRASEKSDVILSVKKAGKN